MVLNHTFISVPMVKSKVNFKNLSHLATNAIEGLYRSYTNQFKISIHDTENLNYYGTGGNFQDFSLSEPTYANIPYDNNDDN